MIIQSDEFGSDNFRGFIRLEANVQLTHCRATIDEASTSPGQMITKKHSF